MGEWSNVVFVDASGTAPTVTLPTPFEGRKVSVKNVTGGNAVTVMQKGSETVEGASSYALSNTADAVTLVCDETPNWHVI